VRECSSIDRRSNPWRGSAESDPKHGLLGGRGNCLNPGLNHCAAAERQFLDSPPEMSDHPAPEIANWPAGVVFTIGHSTLPIDRFIALLRTYGIELLVDIRTVPHSRHNPQFNRPALTDTLSAEGIDCVHIYALGGLRRAHKDSLNTGWRNGSFRGYADYMQTEAFLRALETLILLGRSKRTAIMCAEAVPWQCHRSLVADALGVRGIPVVEILSETSYRMHRLTSFAQVDGMQITYPPEQARLL
jgi:Protein of unknown function, DUF488